MNVYAELDFFQPHCDTADIATNYNGFEHIGTFLIVLNTSFTGGEFQYFDTNCKYIVKNKSCLSDFSNIFQYIYFPLKVKHEIEKIDSGIRGVLKFKVYKHILTNPYTIFPDEGADVKFALAQSSGKPLNTLFGPTNSSTSPFVSLGGIKPLNAGD